MTAWQLPVLGSHLPCTPPGCAVDREAPAWEVIWKTGNSL